MRFAAFLPLTGGAPDYDSVPRASGVVRVTFDVGRPYVGRTSDLRRRIRRLLADEGGRKGLLPSTRRVEYQQCGSRFETAYVLLQAAREAWPRDYRRRLRLRPPTFLRVLLHNEFPRTTVTRKLRGDHTCFFGPFRSRAAAERFETEMLDLFEIRRCVEQLEPAPDHPGCVWGEIGKCTRPCQKAVSAEEYRAQAGRLVGALESSGDHARRRLEEQRDSASEQLDFEAAARFHALREKAVEAFRSAEAPACELSRLHGVVVQRAAEAEHLLLWPLFQGWLQPPVSLHAPAASAEPVSLDRRVREALDASSLESRTVSDREDDLALLSRWWYSNRKRGELVAFDRWDRIPFRRLVNAVSRTVKGDSAGPALTAAMRRQARQDRATGEDAPSA